MSRDETMKKKSRPQASGTRPAKIADRRYLAPFLLALGPIVPGLALWRFFPDEIATHFNIIGEPNAYAPRVFVVFALPVLFALVDLLIFLAVRFEEDAKSKLASREVLACLWIVPIVSWSSCLLIDLKAVNVDVNVRTWTQIILGICLILYGLLMFRIPYRSNFGIRTPWTPGNETNWQMTNRVSAWVYGGIGVFTLLDGFFHIIRFNGWFVIIELIILTPIGVSYYEHYLDLKEQRGFRRKREKTGSAPAAAGTDDADLLRKEENRGEVQTAALEKVQAGKNFK